MMVVQWTLAKSTIKHMLFRPKSSVRFNKKMHHKDLGLDQS
jgi:hypothetical protein